jgi:hypothetical protein
MIRRAGQCLSRAASGFVRSSRRPGYRGRRLGGPSGSRGTASPRRLPAMRQRRLSIDPPANLSRDERTMQSACHPRAVRPARCRQTTRRTTAKLRSNGHPSAGRESLINACAGASSRDDPGSKPAACCTQNLLMWQRGAAACCRRAASVRSFLLPIPGRGPARHWPADHHIHPHLQLGRPLSIPCGVGRGANGLGVEGVPAPASANRRSGASAAPLS